MPDADSRLRMRTELPEVANLDARRAVVICTDEARKRLRNFRTFSTSGRKFQFGLHSRQK